MNARSPFPRAFLWGTSISAHQVEGGNVHNDWWAFEQRRGRPRSQAACDFVHRFEDDLDRARDLGTNSFRFSIEWSRVEPEPTVRDPRAVAYYDRLIDACLERGLRPMVTLVQLTLPRWCARSGGWLARDTQAAFLRHVRWVAERWTDRVERFVTFAEPNVAAGAGYVAGIFPPGEHLRFRRADRCQAALLRAHAGAYAALHEVAARRPGRSVKVGVAPHLVAIRQGAWDPGGAVARAFDRFNWAFLDALVTGDLVLPTSRERVAEARGCLDFVGVNYFMAVRADLGGALRFAGLLRGRPGPATSDVGWCVDPAGLEEIVLEAHRRSRVPIVVTENGVADASDALRPGYLTSHVDALERAARAGAAVEGYHHWSLLDGFEWNEGYRARFGLFEVDFSTQRRTARKSAGVYRALIARHQENHHERPRV